MNKRVAVLSAFFILAAGCHSEAPQRTAQGATDDGDAKSELPPMQVAATAVQEQAPAVLAKANWTRKACALTVANVDDSVKEVPVAPGNPARLSGYFIDPEDQPAGDFSIVLLGLDRNYTFAAKTGWDRTDVAKYFGKPQLANSGFDVSVDLSGIPDGTYKVDYVVDRHTGSFFCESGKALTKASRPEGAGHALTTSEAVPQSGH